jgi:hypothetical protein
MEYNVLVSLSLQRPSEISLGSIATSIHGAPHTQTSKSSRKMSIIFAQF